MAMVFSNLSLRLSYVLIRTSVTPNQLTMLSTIIGLTGAAMILSTNYWLRILGIVIWFVAYVLDFCDGEIARYRRLQSEFGHWFDEVTDRVKDVGLYTAITLLAVRESSSVIAILLGSLALGGTIVYSYAVTYRFQTVGNDRKDGNGPSPDKFGHVNYLVMAVLVGFNLAGLFLAFVTAVTYSSLAIKIYRSHQTMRGPEARSQSLASTGGSASAYSHRVECS
jgi:phosphatidylglycerophosphate synthase